jgi:hypothetical protein
MTTVAKAEIKAEIKAALEDLLQRTIWPNVGQPAASTFHAVARDLKIIQPYTDWNFEGKPLIAIRHRSCRGEVRFDADDHDPIMSEYVCTGMSTEGYDFCDWHWRLADVQKMNATDIAFHFYTELLEEISDLEQWPLKLCEVQSGGLRYTTTRPITKGELLEARVKRMFAIRESK